MALAGLVSLQRFLQVFGGGDPLGRGGVPNYLVLLRINTVGDELVHAGIVLVQLRDALLFPQIHFWERALAKVALDDVVHDLIAEETDLAVVNVSAGRRWSHKALF